MRGQVLAVLLDSAPQTWRSTEELQLRLSRAFIQRGVRPLLIFSEDPSEEIRDRYLAHGVEVLPSLNYEKGLINFHRQLGRIVKNYSVTAVHIVFFSYFSLIPWMARLRGVRYIVHHERNSGILSAKSWKKRLLQFRTAVTTYPITRVITISHFLKRQLAEVGIAKEKIAVVHHGVDICRFLPDRYARARLANKFAIRPDEVILSTVSYLRPFKNVHVILRACAVLAKRGVAARLLVAGDGDMRTGLEALTLRLGIADRVHWLGNVADPTSLLQGSDIYVMATVGEAFGMALVEAMACGAAVVATRSGAFSEIIEDGKSGLLVPPLDALALADALERLAGDGQLRNCIAKIGVERVRQHFVADQSVDKILDVYESIWAMTAYTKPVPAVTSVSTPGSPGNKQTEVGE
jgi:glycosyltransferase involved in cell wall biosynthesis